MPPRLLTLLAIALPLAACLPTTSEPAKTSARTPPYRQNPNPKHAYRITLQIKDAPGPFAAIQAHAQYQLVNPPCLPPRLPFSGRQSMTSSASIRLPVTRVSDTVYAITAYADGMEDADYFGRGVCHWRLLLSGFHLRATGASGETVFKAILWETSIPEQRSETLYFWSKYYPHAKYSRDFADFGQPSLESVPEDRRNEFFTMTITSKEVTR